MSKDPAVLFYTSDFLTGVTLLTMEERGQYITLLCQQHQVGHLPENHMISVCNSKDSKVMKKFVQDKEGNYYNKRMKEEIINREEYCKSRSHKGLSGRKRKNHMKTVRESYGNRIENENENENKDININKKEKKIKHKYGEYKHVLLTDEEKEKLENLFGEDGAIEKIKNLDEGIELKGYKYKSHYLAILKWSTEEKKRGWGGNG